MSAFKYQWNQTIDVGTAGLLSKQWTSIRHILSLLVTANACLHVTAYVAVRKSLSTTYTAVVLGLLLRQYVSYQFGVWAVYQARVRRLVTSLRRRLVAVINARGGPTRYWKIRNRCQPCYFINRSMDRGSRSPWLRYFKIADFDCILLWKGWFFSRPETHSVILCTSFISIPWNRNNLSSHSTLSRLMK